MEGTLNIFNIKSLSAAIKVKIDQTHPICEDNRTPCTALVRKSAQSSRESPLAESRSGPTCHRKSCAAA